MGWIGKLKRSRVEKKLFQAIGKLDALVEQRVEVLLHLSSLRSQLRTLGVEEGSPEESITLTPIMEELSELNKKLKHFDSRFGLDCQDCEKESAGCEVCKNSPRER